MIQSQIVGAGWNNRPVPWILHRNGTLYVNQLLLTIRFLPVNRFYEPTGIIVNNNTFWLNLYDIWILEHKGATMLQKSGAIRVKPESGGEKCLRFEGGA